MPISIRCLSAALFSFVPWVQAAEAPVSALDAVEVTATRTPRQVDKSLASVTVVDRAEIERRQAQTVPDVLRGIPGLTMTNDGGLGKNTSFFLRGTNSDHVLVLIDGARAGSPTLGSTAFQDLPIDQIDRIEVVRGPRASLYGSEAIGGVIQIFTRKGAKGLRPQLSFGAGSHGLYRASGGVSGGDDHGWFNVSGARLESRGFNSCDGQAAVLGGGCFTRELDPDGYRNTSASAHAGYRFDNGLEAEGSFMHAKGDTEFDGAFQNRTQYVQQALSGKVSYTATDFWTTSFRAGRTLDQADNFNKRLFSTRFDTERFSAGWQNDFHIAEGHLLTLGFDYYNDHVNSSVDYAVRSRDDKAGFLQYQMTVDGFDAVLGVRYDDNEQFGGRPTGNVALGYSFDNGVRVSGSWGNAFKAPTFNELYYPGFGNPNLAPEESRSWEFGINGNQLGVKWALNGFHTELDQLIVPVLDVSRCGPPFFFCAQNVAKARIMGLEAQASTQLFGFDLAGTLTLLDPENLADGPNRGNILPRRAQQVFRFDIDRAVGPARLGATVYGEGRRFEELANQRRLNGFVTVDLRASVDIYKGLSVEGRLANLLDEHYQTSWLYHQDGRNFLISLRYQPESL